MHIARVLELPGNFERINCGLELIYPMSITAYFVNVWEWARQARKVTSRKRFVRRRNLEMGRSNWRI